MSIDETVAMTAPTRPAPIDLQQYMSLVDKCAKNRLNYPIPNGSPAHARVLIAKLFETAQREALLISGKLTDATSTGEDIYGDAILIERARHFLQGSGTALKIILTKDTVHKGDDNRLIKALSADRERKGKLIIYSGHERLRNENIPHFMVTDALAYRFETKDSSDGMTGESVEATANFGDEKTARNLQALFETVKLLLRGTGEPKQIDPIGAPA